MDISLDKGLGSYTINSYAEGVITINGEPYHAPLLVGLETLQQDDLCQRLEHLNIEMLQQLNIDECEVFILGTGEELTFPEWDLLEQAQVLGTPIEVMATGAACRTFTILASEGRQVSALLYP